MCKLSSSDILTIRTASTGWEYFFNLVDDCIILVKYIPYQFDLQKYIPYQFDLLKSTVFNAL